MKDAGHEPVGEGVGYAWRRPGASSRPDSGDTAGASPKLTAALGYHVITFNPSPNAVPGHTAASGATVHEDALITQLRTRTIRSQGAVDKHLSSGRSHPPIIRELNQRIALCSLHRWVRGH
jgi:hypothetical protein